MSPVLLISTCIHTDQSCILGNYRQRRNKSVAQTLILITKPKFHLSRMILKKPHSTMNTHKYILTEMAPLWPLNLWMSWQVSGFHKRTNLFFPPDACNGKIICNNTTEEGDF